MLLLDFSDLFGPVEVIVVALVEAVVETAGGASKREFEMQFVVFSELLALFFLLDFDEIFKSVSLSRWSSWDLAAWLSFSLVFWSSKHSGMHSGYN